MTQRPDETQEPPNSSIGLRCPRCGCRHFSTVRTQPHGGGFILRRRECRHCGWRITTKEKPAGT